MPAGDVDISDAIRGSFSRCLGRDGVLLVGSFFAASFIPGMLSLTVATRLGMTEFVLPMTFNQPLLVVSRILGANGTDLTSAASIAPAITIGSGIVLFGLVKLALAIVALRVFSEDPSPGISWSVVERNMPWVALSFVGGWIVYSVLVTLGLILLVLPGIYIAVALSFWMVFVAVEGNSIGRAFENSWELTSGHRFSLFVLGVVLTVITSLLGVIGSLVRAVGTFGPGFRPGEVSLPVIVGVGSVTMGINAFTDVFSIGVLAVAYRQLRVEENTDSESPPDLDGAPSHVCRSCGEEYHTNPTIEIDECRSCGGIKVESTV